MTERLPPIPFEQLSLPACGRRKRWYNAALALFGEHGVVDLVDLVGLRGYDALLAMVMSTAHSAVRASGVAPLASGWLIWLPGRAR